MLQIINGMHSFVSQTDGGITIDQAAGGIWQTKLPHRLAAIPNDKHCGRHFTKRVHYWGCKQDLKAGRKCLFLLLLLDRGASRRPKPLLQERSHTANDELPSCTRQLFFYNILALYEPHHVIFWSVYCIWQPTGSIFSISCRSRIWPQLSAESFLWSVCCLITS
jgi:hypothetical protein